MPESISWILVTQVLQGLGVTATASIDDVDAHDKLKMNLADIDSQKVKLMPASPIDTRSVLIWILVSLFAAAGA